MREPLFLGYFEVFHSECRFAQPWCCSETLESMQDGAPVEEVEPLMVWLNDVGAGLILPSIVASAHNYYEDGACSVAASQQCFLWCDVMRCRRRLAGVSDGRRYQD